MSDDFFRANLATVCSYHSSIAEVCRKLRINRQQFNKYLNGQSRPSRHNMRRICDFFGVTEGELLLEPARFEDLVSLRRRPLPMESFTGPMSHIESLFRASNTLDRYVGYYFRYFYSFGYAGYIVKSLCVLFEDEGRYYWKNVEIMRRHSTGNPTAMSKYLGAAFYIADRIFVVEYDCLLRTSVTEALFYPSYQTGVDKLIGIQTGGPVRRGRQPAASKVLLQYLGRRIDLRKALAQADIYPEDDPRIDPDIPPLIRNTIPEGSYVLEVEQL